MEKRRGGLVLFEAFIALRVLRRCVDLTRRLSGNRRLIFGPLMGSNWPLGEQVGGEFRTVLAFGGCSEIPLFAVF